MPFRYLIAGLADWIKESRDLAAAAAEPSLGTEQARSIRGLVFITLFGGYERTVCGCFSTAVAQANGHALAVGTLRPGLVVFALHPQIQALRDASSPKIWSHCSSIFERVRGSEIATLVDTFPRDGSFMKPSQLELIWALFELPGAPWPEPRLIGRVHELVGVRNRLAHGEEPPSAVGSRFSMSELEERINDVEALCSHIISAFQSRCGTAAGFFV